ncbi:MAG: hypothetical protein ACLGIG_04045 [Actinomycetes bacterium]
MSHATTFDVDNPSLAAAAPTSGADERAERPRALELRRWFLVAAPLLAGVFLTVGAVADPAAGISGDRMLEIYGANPEPLQLKSLGYHWAYAFWLVPAMLIAPLVRGRGAWLATVTAFVGFVGVSTMPGLLMSDWFDSAVVAAHGLEGHRAMTDVMDTMWGIPVFIAPGIVGLFLALPLAMATLWRAGLARWWGLVAAVGAMVAFMVSNATWPGTVAATALFGVVSFALAGATREAQGTA